MITMWCSKPVPERGDRAGRCVRVEPARLRRQRESRATMDGLWSGMDLPGEAR
jgi:hypothetical protein